LREVTIRDRRSGKKRPPGPGKGENEGKGHHCSFAGQRKSLFSKKGEKTQQGSLSCPPKEKKARRGRGKNPPIASYWRLVIVPPSVSAPTSWRKVTTSPRGSKLKTGGTKEKRRTREGRRKNVIQKSAA